jgi:chromate transporter
MSLPERPRPQSLTDLFVSFTLLALQGFGGVLAVVQRELVERKQWLTHEEFIEDWAVAQIMPGPNVVNLSLMIGGATSAWPARWPRWPACWPCHWCGAAAGRAACALCRAPGVAGALRGMAAVSAGMIGAAGLKLSVALARNPMPLPWCVALAQPAFAAVALLHLPLGWVLLGLGGPGLRTDLPQAGRMSAPVLVLGWNDWASLFAIT